MDMNDHVYCLILSTFTCQLYLIVVLELFYFDIWK